MAAGVITVVGGTIVYMASSGGSGGGGRRSNNQSENKKFREAARRIERQIGRKLSKDDLQRLHREISWVYMADWRIEQGAGVVVGSNDVADFVDEVLAGLGPLDFQELVVSAWGDAGFTFAGGRRRPVHRLVRYEDGPVGLLLLPPSTSSSSGAGAGAGATTATQELPVTYLHLLAGAWRLLDRRPRDRRVLPRGEAGGNRRRGDRAGRPRGLSAPPPQGIQPLTDERGRNMNQFEPLSERAVFGVTDHDLTAAIIVAAMEGQCPELADRRDELLAMLSR